MSSEPGNESFFCALRPIPRILSLRRRDYASQVQIGELSRRKTISGCSRVPDANRYVARWRCPWRIADSGLNAGESRFCYDDKMGDIVILFVHVISTFARLLGPGGLRSVVAESALVKLADLDWRPERQSLEYGPVPVRIGHIVVDDSGSRRQVARFQNPLQRPPRSHCTGRAAACPRRAYATTRGRYPLLSMATSLPRPISHTDRRLILQREVPPAVSGRHRQTARAVKISRCLIRQSGTVG
jgi:hypothetical protein